MTKIWNSCTKQEVAAGPLSGFLEPGDQAGGIEMELPSTEFPQIPAPPAQRVQNLSLGNHLLKAFAKYYLAQKPKECKEIDSLASELMNAQCMFNYIEEVAPEYSNYEDVEIDWDISCLLQQVELVLNELDGLNILETLPQNFDDAQRSQMAKYRIKLCVYVHLACIQIMINSFEDEDNSLSIRIEGLLCTFRDRFYEPVSNNDRQLRDWLQQVVTAPATGSPETLLGNEPGVSSEQYSSAELSRRPLRTQAPVARIFETAVNEQLAPGVQNMRSHELNRSAAQVSDDVDLKVIKQRSASESDEFKFLIRHVRPNENPISRKQILVIEEDGNTYDALRSIAARIEEWLATSPGGLSASQGVISFPYQGIGLELQEIGKEIIKKNFLFQVVGDSLRPNSAILNAHFIGWTVKDWMRLSRWWLSRGTLERNTTGRSKLGPKAPNSPKNMEQSSTESLLGPSFNLNFIKSIFIIHTLIGGSGIWHLLDRKQRTKLEKLDRDIRVTCSLNGLDINSSLKQINLRLAKGKIGPSRASNGFAAATMLDMLIIVDKTHVHEERDGFSAEGIVLNVEFQALAAVEFNTRPSGPILNQDLTTYVLVQVGYTDRERNIPHIRLRNSHANIIKSASFSAWEKIEVDQVGVRYDVDVRYIKVREMFVSFIICSEQDRVAFNEICSSITTGNFLKKEKSRSWSIESATYRTSKRAQPLTCRAGRLTMTELLLPGSQGGSRKRSITVQTRYRGQGGFTVDHIPLHSIEVRNAAPKNSANGAAIEISWKSQTVPQEDYMFSPYHEGSHPKIHHYHIDRQDRLLSESKHTSVQRQFTSHNANETDQIPAEHAYSRMVCTPKMNGAYFCQEGVIGESRYEGSSWSCPFSEKETSSGNVVIHWLTVKFTSDSAVTRRAPSEGTMDEFHRWLFQKDPDELTLEKHIWSSPFTNQTNELHIFESELFPERRIVEIQKRDHEQKVKISFVNALTSLSLENISQHVSAYRLRSMLSHPYRSRRFDGDVGRDWAYDSTPLSEYRIEAVENLPILKILCPHWINITAEKALSHFIGLALRPTEQTKSLLRRKPKPIFEHKNGKFEFYHDPWMKRFLCWTYGDHGNTFIYFSIESVSKQVIKFNNTIQLEVLYEINSVSGLEISSLISGATKPVQTSMKRGLVDIEFADSASPFRRFYQSQIKAATVGDYSIGSRHSTSESSSRISTINT